MRDLRTTIPQLLANTLYQEYKGASLDINFLPPKEGYLVSVIQGPIFDKPGDISPIKVAGFIRENIDTLTRYSSYYFAGTWQDDKTGKVYFDISVRYDDLEEAKRFAREVKQIAIYDVVNGCEIRL